MSDTVDARGRTCPEPVILTRQALDEAESVTTIVDNETAQRNVTRMAEAAGRTVVAEKRDDGIYLHIGRPEAAPAPQVGRAEILSGPLVLTVGSEHMGRGDDAELGALLMRNFFYALSEADPLPDVILFFNAGVRLVSDESPVLQHLRALQDRGVEMLACGTCLSHFGLEEKLAVGKMSNMLTIAETMLGAGKVVAL